MADKKPAPRKREPVSRRSSGNPSTPKVSTTGTRALNAKELRFVEEYLIDLNGAQAAIRAGYSKSGPNVTACRLLSRDNVQAAIAAGMAARSERTKITQDMVLEELAKLAFSDPRKFFREDGTIKHPTELDDKTAAALAQFEIKEEFADEDPDEEIEPQPHGGGLRRQYGRKTFSGYTTKIKWADKRASLVDIGKHLGMFIDRKEIKVGELERLDDDSLNARIAQAAAQIAESEGVPVETVLNQVREVGTVH